MASPAAFFPTSLSSTTLTPPSFSPSPFLPHLRSGRRSARSSPGRLFCCSSFSGKRSSPLTNKQKGGGGPLGAQGTAVYPPEIAEDIVSTETSLARRHRQDEEAQELTVYEVNERDRNSPHLLPFNAPNFDFQRLRPAANLGLFVCFTNKLFDGSLKRRLGITAGQCMVIKYNQEKGGCLYEATYSLYFGEFGHISVQGPYTDYGDTVLAVTGGSGIFMGVYGTVTLKNVRYPEVLFYRFKLYGIPKLPPQLRWDTVPPTRNVKPAPNASSPGVAFPNFTD